MNLRELQNELASVVVNPLAHDQSLRRTMAGGKDAVCIAERHIRPSARLSSSERIQIYNRQYWFRLIDCLFDDYPGLVSLVGERQFYDLAVAYLTKYPSTSFTLRNLGKNLVQFLNEEPRWLGRRTRIGIQMAVLEWAKVVAFDGPALPTLTPSEGTESFSGSSQLTLQPYLSLLKFDYPLDTMVTELQRGKRDRSEAVSRERKGEKGEEKVKLPPPEDLYLAVHRHQNELYYKRLEPAAYTLLTDLQRGESLSVSCDNSGRRLRRKGIPDSEISLLFQEWFTLWSSLGWFCKGEPDLR